MSRLFVCCVILASTVLAEAAPDGSKLYQTQCAKCHGERGEGVAKKYAKPLTGELSVPQLADIVRKTMPEDAPESLSTEDATAIATHMMATFYAKPNKPIRADLSRLTVPQYRQSVADLMAGFRWNTNTWKDGGKGLKGEYFANRGHGNLQLERTDALVSFDFGTNPPTEGKYENHEFSIRWTGSLLAPATGEYTFTVRSDHSVKLWVNDREEPIINALVRSGDQTEYTAPMTLTAGRSYFLKLEFSKALQGVKDKKPKPTPAFVKLEWTPPHSIGEPIPTRFLSPQAVSTQHLVTVRFPPDDRSLGWERGTSVSKEWDNATTEGALEAAAFVQKNLYALAQLDPKEPAAKNLPGLKNFAVQFVERAFRRPLSADQKELYIERQFNAYSGQVDVIFQRIVLLTLKSPRFLFRDVSEANDSFDIAARLSFALLDSLPDEALRVAAAQNTLTRPEELRKHAERLLNDPRAQVKLRGFLLHWLRLDHDRDLGKNTKAYPGFDAQAIADLRTSLDLGLDDVLQSADADFRQFFRSDDVYLNGRLAKLYGVTLAADAPFRKLKLNPGQRAGILTHPYLLTAYAYADQSSPIHRGVFLAKGILGTGLKPPQDAFSPLNAAEHPELNTRERVSLQTKGANCQTCHTIINNLGFTLESFDAVGAFREKDNGKPIDSTGSYLKRDGTTQKFAGAADLANFLADSPDAAGAFVDQMFHHLVQQPLLAYGPSVHDDLAKDFAKQAFNLRKLAVEVALTGANRGRAK